MNVILSPAFLFGTGLDEWAVLGAIAFLLFGPRRLPEIARTIGRTLEKIRRAADDFREQVAHLDDPAPQPPPPMTGLPPVPRAVLPAAPGPLPESGAPRKPEP